MLYPKDHLRLEPLSDERLHVQTEQTLRAIAEEAQRKRGSFDNLAFFERETDYDRQRRYLERMLRSQTDELFLIREGEYDSLAGTIGLHEIDQHLRNARIGAIIFNSNQRGKGLGSRSIGLLLAHAFGERGLNKVYLNVFSENEKGRRLYKRLGFVEEGILRQEYLLRGKFHDFVRMSMLASEWRELSRKE